MAKKNYDKKVAKKEVNEVLDKAIVSDEIVKENIQITDEEPLLEESLALDMDKLSDDLEEMKKEIFEEEPKIEEVVAEKPKENKTFVNRLYGLIWNGQEYDY
jgi:hypothetical protein